jgi:hypothetical protein
MLSTLAPHVLADELPVSHIDPSNAVTIVIVIQTMIIVVGCVFGIIAFIASLRRKPAIEAEFATKAELNSLRSEMKQDIGGLFGRLDALTTSINSSTNAILRDIGKIEGQHDLARSIVEAVRK